VLLIIKSKKKSKKLWEKHASDINVRVFKNLNWPKKNNFLKEL